MSWFIVRMICFGLASAATGLAALILSGVSFFLADAAGNNAGQFWGYNGVRVWVEESGNWVSSSNGQLSLLLTNGSHTFSFYASGNGILVGQAGVNIFLGATCSAGISVRGSSGSSAFAANAGISTFWPESSVVPGCTNAAGTGSLSWKNGTDLVTLTQFTYVDHRTSGVNLVSYGSINPPGSTDAISDHFGTFTLVVNPQATGNVPEPSSCTLLTIGCAAIIWRHFRSRRQPGRRSRLDASRA